jgi:hypothetical protein
MAAGWSCDETWERRTMTEIADRDRRRADAFQRTIEFVSADQWSNHRRAKGWTAKDVVDQRVVS